MTALTKSDFTVFSGYVSLINEDGSRTFIARFKYAATSSANPFVTFVCRNFTKEEVIAMIDSVNDGSAPVYKAAQDKGFLLSHVKTMLRRGGYEVSRAGYEQMLDDQVRAYRDRKAA